MSYRPRRGRSRTPPRFRPGHPLIRTERPPEDLKRSREREESKRGRWESDRGRPRGRSRSPRRLNRSRTNSIEKRERFEPPPFVQSKRSRSNERSKFVEYPRLNSWSRDEEPTSKFSPPNRFSPAHFQPPQENRNDSWNSVEIDFATNTYAPVDNIHTTTNPVPPPLMVLDEDFRINEPKKIEEPGSAIPEFNPETSKLSSQDWIKLIDTTAKDRDWKQDEKVYVLTSRLAGYARQWHLNTGIKCKNWNELKQAFFTAFPSENDYYQLLKKMIARTKEERETVTAYFHHKVALLNACDIYGRKAVSCIVGGLPNSELKEKCKNQNFDDPDLLYQFLRSQSDNSPERQRRKKVEEKKQPLKKSVTNQICFYCKKKGHVAVNCELKQKHVNSIPEMPKQRGGNNHGSVHQKPTYNKYFTEVSINGLPLKGYVDQGCEFTTIREGNAHYLKLSFTKHYKMVKGFGGHMVAVIGVANVPICVDRAIANVKIYIVSDDSQSIPIIVGQSFTEQPHVVIMKDGDKVRFYQRMDNGQANFDF